MKILNISTYLINSLIHKYTELLCFTPETNIMLYVIYTSIKNEKECKTISQETDT